MQLITGNITLVSSMIVERDKVNYMIAPDLIMSGVRFPESSREIRIIKAVTFKFGNESYRDVFSKNKSRVPYLGAGDVLNQRHICIYLLRVLLHLDQEKIVQLFSSVITNRSTVSLTIKKVDGLMQVDKKFRQRVYEIVSVMDYCPALVFMKKNNLV